MAITNYTDRELELTQRLSDFSVKLVAANQLAQLNGEIAAQLKRERDALQEEVARLNDDVATHMRVAVRAIDGCVELKVERDTLCQQLAEAQALIEASRKQEAVAEITEAYLATGVVEWKVHQGNPIDVGTKLYAAPVVAPDVLTHKYELELPQDDSRTLKVFWTERVIDGQTMAHKLCIAVSLEEGHGITGGQQ
jgi:hypothetical protein